MNKKVTLEQIRKAQIIEATFKKITEIGIQNITLDDIAEEAQLSKGGIAYYYASKDNLIKEAFKEFFNNIFLRSKTVMDQCADPIDKLLSFTWLYNWDDPLVEIGYSILFDAMSLASHDKDFRDIFHEWFNEWISLLGLAIEECNARGLLSIADIKGTAKAISSIYQGVATRWYLDRDNHSSEWAVSFSRKAITGLLNRPE
ncbi:MAG: TetR/AcrR family transcriptional regulator [Spirochaetes bacterium]|nr:TetR/AcrR family transcriptional regulator [Spirochaetota bacterium]